MVRIEWKPEAEDDLNVLVDLIAQDNQINALNFLEEIEKFINDNLGMFPELGKRIREKKDPNIRHWIFKKT